MVVNKGPAWFVKIADFGISKRRQQDVTTSHTQQRGTLGYAAPEFFGFTRENTNTFSVDMWSLGAVAYRMLTSAIPFMTTTDLLKYMFRQTEFPTASLETHQVSDIGRDFILMLMAACPKECITSVSTSRHEWLAGVSTGIGKQQHGIL